MDSQPPSNTSLRNQLQQSSQNCAKTLILPTVFVVLFVIQNTAFNLWLHIVPHTYPQMRAASFALGVLLYGPSILLSPKRRHIYLLSVSTLISILFISEYLYFSYAGAFLQISSLKLLGESKAVVHTAFGFLSPKLLLFLANTLIAALLPLHPRTRLHLNQTLIRHEKTAIASLILLTVFTGYHTLYAAEIKDIGNASRLYKQQYDLNSVIGKMGVVNYFLEDATKRLITQNEVSKEDKDFVKEWASTRSKLTTTKNNFGIAKGRNLIILQVESLENAVIDTKLNKNEITPNLNALLKDSLYFSKDYAQVGLGNTADAEFTTLNSLYSLPEDVAFVDHAQNHYTALPHLLIDHGYNTNVFHGDVPSFWNRSNIYPQLGYQHWIMKDQFQIHRDIGITGLGDQDFLEQSLSKIQTLPQPFMATLITLSSHTPFILPTDLQTLAIPTSTTLNDTQIQYLQSIHYTDRVIGDFIANLKKTNLYQNSIIAIYGDHGSYTGISSALGVEKDDVNDMNNYHIPLLILIPGTNLTGEKTIPTSHLDLYPTLINLLGIEPPPTLLGQDLLNTETPVALHRKSGTGGISSIISSHQIFIAPPDGEFTKGQCLSPTNRSTLPIKNCQDLYTQQTNLLRASDTIVRADLLKDLE